MRKEIFDESEMHQLLQIIEFWNDKHRMGANVGDKIFKFFGYEVDGLGKRDMHWWVAKGDFKSFPFKSTNGSICSDHRTLEEAIKSSEESNKREGLEFKKIKVRK